MLRSLEAILRNCISRLDAAEKKAKTDAVREREMAKIRAMLMSDAGGIDRPFGISNEWLRKPIMRASHD